MNRITAFEIAVAVVGAMTFAGIAAIAPPAQADDLDVVRHTVPAAVTEGSYGPYCSIHPLPAWTCDQELSANGNAGITDSGHSTVTPPKPTPPAPPSPPSPPGPTTGGDL